MTHLWCVPFRRRQSSVPTSPLAVVRRGAPGGGDDDPDGGPAGDAVVLSSIYPGSLPAAAGTGRHNHNVSASLLPVHFSAGGPFQRPSLVSVAFRWGEVAAAQISGVRCSLSLIARKVYVVVALHLLSVQALLSASRGVPMWLGSGSGLVVEWLQRLHRRPYRYGIMHVILFSISKQCKNVMKSWQPL